MPNLNSNDCPLSSEEQSRLSELESVVQRGLDYAAAMPESEFNAMIAAHKDKDPTTAQVFIDYRQRRQEGN